MSSVSGVPSWLMGTALHQAGGNACAATACISDLQIGTCKYGQVRDILTNNRDLSAPPTAGERGRPDHAYVCGPD